MLLLEVSGLSCRARNTSLADFFMKEKTVLRGIDLALEENSSLALIGESGSGKTTLARCLAGLQRPDAGTITFAGVNIFPDTGNRRSIGLEIQMLFQGSAAALDPSLTIRDSLIEAIEARPPRTSRAFEEAGRLISSVGLRDECLARFPRHLSGGELQRVALARVLVVAPRLLILDEPTSALDAVTAVQLLQLLAALQRNQKFSLLYITHHLRLGFSFCERVAVLHEGKILESGPSSEILRNPRQQYTAQLLRDSRMDAASSQ
jgi:ABC-type glutathione transport system ATPase component